MNSNVGYLLTLINSEGNAQKRPISSLQRWLDYVKQWHNTTMQDAEREWARVDKDIAERKHLLSRGHWLQ